MKFAGTLSSRVLGSFHWVDADEMRLFSSTRAPQLCHSLQNQEEATCLGRGDLRAKTKLKNEV